MGSAEGLGLGKQINWPSLIPTMLHLKSNTLFSRKMGTSRPTADRDTLMAGTTSLRCAGARNDTDSGSLAGPVSVGEKTQDRVVELYPLMAPTAWWMVKGPARSFPSAPGPGLLNDWRYR